MQRIPAFARLLLLPLVALALLAAACGDDDTTATTGDDDAGSDGAGAGDVIVQVTVGGGFTTPTTALSTIPQLTVLGDGTVLTPGIITLSYPGPAIMPVQAGTADQAAIDALLDTAGTLGLLDGPLDFGSPGISDAPTTTVTIVVDGVTHRHEAYALSFGADEGLDAGGEGDAAANRQALADFVAATDGLAVGDRTWDPPAIVATVVGPAPVDAELAEPAVDWPLATPPTVTGDFPCTLIEGDDVGTLGAALATANELTPWIIDGEEYAIAFRPLVPGDAGCP
jgi:hypothetical protein